MTTAFLGIAPRRMPTVLIESLTHEGRPLLPVSGEVVDILSDDKGRVWVVVWLDNAVTWGDATFAYALVEPGELLRPLGTRTVDVHIRWLNDPAEAEAAFSEPPATQARATLSGD